VFWLYKETDADNVCKVLDKLLDDFIEERSSSE